MDQNKTPEAKKSSYLLFSPQNHNSKTGKILLGTTLFVLFLLILNYFNMIPISSRYPKFSWLPHLSQSTMSTELIINCPVNLELCKSAWVIREGDFAGLGFTLPKGTQLKAAFDGTLTDQPKIKERPANEPLIYLQDGKGNEAIYSFYGTTKDKIEFTAVKKGQQIGTIGDGFFPPYPPLNGMNFLFTVKSGGKTMQLDPYQFKE